MSGWLEPGWQAAHVQAEALADALNGKGFATVVYKDGGHLSNPCVQISNGSMWRMPGKEFIYAAPEDGVWWFWWSSMKRIAPAEQVSVAADRIARADLR
jgi:hypothetical protein